MAPSGMAAATRQLLSVTSELFDHADFVFAESKRLTKLDSKVASAAVCVQDALRDARPRRVVSESLSSGVLTKSLQECERHSRHASVRAQESI